MSNEIKNISEFGTPNAFPECEHVNKSDIIGEEKIVEDVHFVPSTFGEGDFAVVKLEGGFTYSVGSSSCIDKLRRVKEQDAFPIKTKLVKKTSKSSGYAYWDYE